MEYSCRIRRCRRRHNWSRRSDSAARSASVGLTGAMTTMTAMMLMIMMLARTATTATTTPPTRRRVGSWTTAFGAPGGQQRVRHPAHNGVRATIAPRYPHPPRTKQAIDRLPGLSSSRSSNQNSSTNANRASPRSSSSSNNNNFKAKKRSVADRTPEEVLALVQDLVQTAMQAGPRAGPARTLQAMRAIRQTATDVLRSNTNNNNIYRRSSSTSSSSSTSNNNTMSVPVLLRKLFERMGATYVKLGQFIASSPTLFPAEYVKEFQKCLDQTDPLPWPTIQAVIERELGGPWSQTYSYIDPVPLASASIAQVHAATLASTGESVVIKVQKPGIDAALQADLGFLYGAARILEFVQPDWERTSLAAVASDIRASMLLELDFEVEARNTIEFRRFLLEQGLMQQATAPLVYPQYSTKRILTLERLNGVSMLDEDTIQSVTQNPAAAAETIITALNIWSLSVTTMPWFHADVHAGNLLLLDDGRVGFIDFGIVGRISDKVFASIQELSAALVMNDSEGMAIALCNMGAADEQVDTKQFGRDIERLLQRMNNVQSDLTVTATSDGRIAGRIEVNESDITNLLLELVEVTENNGLKLPREFGLLVKQSLYFDRYLKILAPNVDVMNDERVMLGGERQRRTEMNPEETAAAAVIDV